jgi:uncharacterized membrane protein
MTQRTADRLSLLFIALSFAFAAVMYPSLPELIPTHWDAAGDVDAYTPKPWGAFLLPAIAWLVFVLMKLIPVISPKGFRTDHFMEVVRLFQVVLVAFMAVLTVMTLLYAAGYEIDMPRFLSAAMGVLFVILGNYLGKVRKNFFIGVRTPWTLASDEVWVRTHRLAAWLFTLAGIATLMSALYLQGLQVAVASALIAGFVPVIYSFLLYRRLEGFEPEGEDEETG